MIYAIRTHSVARYPPDIPCPFRVGAFMALCDGPEYDFGPMLETVEHPVGATFFATEEEAKAVIARFSHYAATFRAVGFVETR